VNAGIRRGVAGAVLAAAVTLLALPIGAGAHGVASADYATTIKGLEPAGLPIDVKVVNGDQLRIQNLGDQVVTLCGYTTKCEPYARISSKGVFVNENSQAYFTNQETDNYAAVPDDAGKGPAKWVRVRRTPAFFTYHDHRVHWMGGNTAPPGVDKSSSAKQKVQDGEVSLLYGSMPVTISTTLYYVGGKSFFERYGEYMLTGAAILVMLSLFVLDARRRRGSRPRVAIDELPQLQGAMD
jgi:hypothetical protein